MVVSQAARVRLVVARVGVVRDSIVAFERACKLMIFRDG